ncbi:hypothetical protein TSOC_010285 [Tetrabaena socialis]|uniref:Uncharacterized protein n=1 Tax=Tetrabaena socialis TaxID=47790 RepID=A0A2J7ZTR3_9CHLO|nr:hypothetical protein TSOC_010285 [Tetrabaena socialis]|eukprot:PNH03663.1 hypothetical protein TSOC_010285 [Tetrabaena socialis]
MTASPAKSNRLATAAAQGQGRRDRTAMDGRAGRLIEGLKLTFKKLGDSFRPARPQDGYSLLSPAPSFSTAPRRNLVGSMPTTSDTHSTTVSTGAAQLDEADVACCFVTLQPDRSTLATSAAASGGAKRQSPSVPCSSNAPMTPRRRLNQFQRDGATSPQARALLRRSMAQQRLGNGGSLTRLPSQARRLEGEMTQEGACQDALRHENEVVAMQAALSGRPCWG